MIDKGYPYPLLSLDLLQPHQEFPEDPIYSVRTPQGRLVTSPALRKRAINITTQKIWDAIAHALGAHKPCVDGLARFGLDEEWAENMRYWGERLYEMDDGRHHVSTRLGFVLADRRELRERAVALWRQLILTAKLARVGSPVPGSPPRGLHELLLGLKLALERLEEPAYAALSVRGFGPEEQACLRRVLVDLEGVPAQELRLTEQRRQATAAIAVVRGALLGDMMQLAGAARLALTPPLSRDLQMGRILGV